MQYRYLLNIININQLAIAWFNGCKQPQVLVNGRKQGSSPKSCPLNLKQQAFICKLQLYTQYTNILRKLSQNPSSTATYHAAKRASKDYQRVKSLLKRGVLNGWISTPAEYEQFAL